MLLDSMTIEFDIGDRTYKQLSLDELVINIEDKNKIYWIHCNVSQSDEDFKKLSQKINLSDELIKMHLEDETIPKLVDTGESLTLRIPCLQTNELPENQIPLFGNLIIHLTEKYCLSLSFTPLPALLGFLESYPKAFKYAETPCFILFILLDNVINDYSKILFDFDLIADEADFHLRETGQENIYNQVMDTKNNVLRTKHHMGAIRDILMRISGRKIAVISEACRMSLGNLFSHCQMVGTEADAIRDMLNGILDKIDNSLMQKMNETMKVLTAFAAIFLPVALIPSIYGMNFHWIPELNWKYGYFWALFLMFFFGGLLWAFFKKKKWF